MSRSQGNARRVSHLHLSFVRVHFTDEAFAVAGLIVLVYDMLWSCDKEYQFIFA